MKIVHFSDSHWDESGVDNLRKAINDLKDYDLLLHTGDICPNCFEDSFSAFEKLPKFALTVGNHDMILRSALDPSGYRWEKQPTQEQAYNKFFKRIKNLVTIKENTTYWYKELKDCMVIGIDYTARSDVYYNEWYWLDSLLKRCLENDTPVFIASHAFGRYKIIKLNFDFTCYNYAKEILGAYPDTVGLYPFQQKAYDIVSSYADKGLRVIAWVHGHEHADIAMTSNNANKFPIIVIGSTLHDEWNDTIRTNNSDYKKDVVMNIYEWNKNSDSLKVTRLGANTCSSGCYRDVMGFDYRRKEYVSRVARGI